MTAKQTAPTFTAEQVIDALADVLLDRGMDTDDRVEIINTVAEVLTDA